MSFSPNRSQSARTAESSWSFPDDYGRALSGSENGPRSRSASRLSEADSAYSDVITPPDTADPARPFTEDENGVKTHVDGLLWQVASETSQPITVAPSDTSGLFAGDQASREILVTETREFSFAPGLYDKPIDVWLGEERSLRLISSVPALANNLVVLESVAWSQYSVMEMPLTSSITK